MIAINGDVGAVVSLFSGRLSSSTNPERPRPRRPACHAMSAQAEVAIDEAVRRREALKRDDFRLDRKGIAKWRRI